MNYNGSMVYNGKPHIFEKGDLGVVNVGRGRKQLQEIRWRR